MSLISRALALIEIKDFFSAEEVCSEAVQESERLFLQSNDSSDSSDGSANNSSPSSPSLLIRSLRVTAMLFDRQMRFKDAADLLRRALALAPPSSQDAQEVSEELIKQLIQSNAMDEAVRVAEDRYEALQASGTASSDDFAHALLSLATVRGKSGQLELAEECGRKAVALREEAAGGAGHPLTAVALTVLAGVLEDRGGSDRLTEAETLLLRAAATFQRIDGQKGNALAVLAQLQRVRARKEEDRGAFLMRRAGQCFERRSFKEAEAALTEAVDYFTSTVGESHPHTKAAAQNLSVARQNALIQLWQEVAEESMTANATTAVEPSMNDLEAELLSIGVSSKANSGSGSSCVLQ